MSCYFRHLNDIFAEAGISVTAANKKEVDRAIHKIVDVSYKDCPATWKAIKNGIADDKARREFIEKLKTALSAS